jgi:hypothetical protein
MSQECSTLQMILHREQIRAFSPILQQGFAFSVQAGGTLEDFLCSQLRLDPEFVKGRITTIFLNFKPVDDIKSAAVRSGSTLALSGAMPGLVGATMRRGGFYAAMRGDISHGEEGEATLSEEGEIRVKLFNLMMEDLGPVFLLKGIILPISEARSFLALQEPGFWEGCSGAFLEGLPVEPEILKRGDWNLQAGDRIRLCAVFEELKS